MGRKFRIFNPADDGIFCEVKAMSRLNPSLTFRFVFVILY